MSGLLKASKLALAMFMRDSVDMTTNIGTKMTCMYAMTPVGA